LSWLHPMGACLANDYANLHLLILWKQKSAGAGLFRQLGRPRAQAQYGRMRL
jgi:hypothetical protein